MNGSDLVQRAMKASGETSVRAFAARVGVSHTAVQHWLAGDNAPTFEQAAEMAELAGLPPVQTAAQVRMQSKDGAKHRALLRRLSQAAAIAIALLPLGYTHAQTPENKGVFAANVYYVIRRLLNRLAPQPFPA